MDVSYTEIACAIERVAPAMQAVLTKHETYRSAAQETFGAPLVMYIDDRQIVLLGTGSVVVMTVWCHSYMRHSTDMIQHA